MSKRSNDDIPSALKHGGYSGTAVLPGEDPAAFEKLHDRLIAELTPEGPLEEDIVGSIAMLVWRKQNLSTYRVAALERKGQLRAAFDPEDPEEEMSPEEIRAANERAELSRRLEERVEREEVITTDHLLRELAIVDRLDGMIHRCIKRLLMVRGVKSMSASVSTASPQPPKQLSAV